MEKLDIHKGIYDKLNHFIEIQKIPNILFHGKYGYRHTEREKKKSQDTRKQIEDLLKDK